MAECVFDPGAVAGVEHDERACRFLLSCRGLACDGYEVKLCGLRSLAHQLLCSDEFLEVELRSEVDRLFAVTLVNLHADILAQLMDFD